jgi:alkyl hydroperoxide reductase subunit AhpC
MLGDVSRKLAQGFGVPADSGVAVRTIFIVNPEGQVMSIAVNDLNVGRSAQETLRLPHALQSGELTACEWQPGQPFVAVA